MAQPTNLWTLTQAEWPLSRKFLVADVGHDALTLPSKELIKRLQTDGGVGLIAATQPLGVQCILFDGAVGKYAKYCAHPKNFLIYFECANGWCRTSSPSWHLELPTQRVPVAPLARPRQPLLIDAMCPNEESVQRVGAQHSLRIMTMLYLTEIYMKGYTLYWKHLTLPTFKQLDLSVLENCFGDMPSHRPLLITVKYAALLVNAEGVVRYFDPLVDTDTMRIMSWYAHRAGLDFEQVNKTPMPLEDAYYFVAGKEIERLVEWGQMCYEANLKKNEQKFSR